CCSSSGGADPRAPPIFTIAPYDQTIDISDSERLTAPTKPTGAAVIDTVVTLTVGRASAVTISKHIESTGSTTCANNNSDNNNTMHCNRRSSMMDVLPLVLLLVMGVVISTTCGKYTASSTSQANTGDSGDTSQPSSTTGALLANGYYHHNNNDDEQDQSGHHPHHDRSDINDNIAHFEAPAAAGDGAQQQSLSLMIDSSQLSAPGGGSLSSASARLSALLAANNPSNRSPQVMLKNASVTCNDGTVAGYYIRQNYASKRWVVFLEGGWYCFSALTCHQRWLKMRGLMTSAHWPEAKTVGGILSSSRDENPYYWNASHVYVPYCSSDIWSGDSAARAPGDLSFLGSRIVEQVIRELLPRGLTDAKLLILAGSSAGAAGVMINLDRIASLLTSVGSSAQVKGIADSGWIMDNEPFGSPNSAPTGAANTGVDNHNNHKINNKKPCVDAINCAPMDGIRSAFKMWNSRVPAACAAQYTREPWRCLFGYRLYPTLRTPLFVFQWLYDEAQMHLDGVSLTHSQQQFKYIHSLGRQLRASLENVSAVFSPSCIAHIVLTKPDWRTIAINGVRLPDAIRCWEQTCSGPTQLTTLTAGTVVTTIGVVEHNLLAFSLMPASHMF
ncbi:unnamed protein product, partial [Medioppia subpectinata]